jgi:hypothetical protein
MSIKKQNKFIGNNISRLAMEYIGLSTGLICLNQLDDIVKCNIRCLGPLDYIWDDIRSLDRFDYVWRLILYSCIATICLKRYKRIWTWKCTINRFVRKRNVRHLDRSNLVRVTPRFHIWDKNRSLPTDCEINTDNGVIRRTMLYK